MSGEILIGEHVRALDARHRLSLPPEFTARLLADGSGLVLAKERPGCLSLWSSATWTPRFESAVAALRAKLEAGLLARRLGRVQEIGRLLSTRHHPVTLSGRDRLVIPEGFRDFLGVAPGSDLLVVGAALCVELWRPTEWAAYIAAEMPGFGDRLDELAG